MTAPTDTLPRLLTRWRARFARDEPAQWFDRSLVMTLPTPAPWEPWQTPIYGEVVWCQQTDPLGDWPEDEELT